MSSKYKMKKLRIVLREKVIKFSLNIKYLKFIWIHYRTLTYGIYEKRKKIEIARALKAEHLRTYRDQKKTTGKCNALGSPKWSGSLGTGSTLGAWTFKRDEKNSSAARTQQCVAAYCTVLHDAANLLAGIPSPFTEFIIQQRSSMNWSRKGETLGTWRKIKKKIQTEIRRRTIAQWEKNLSQTTKANWTGKLIQNVAA